MKKFMLKRTLAPLSLSGVLILFLLVGPHNDSLVSAIDPGTYKSLKVFNEAMDIVEKNYVEKVDPKTLIQGAINGMVKSLDPHSSYLSADMYKELQSETKGSFGGIGTEITIQNEILTIVSPIEDTPAYQAGLKAGDQIIKIDDKPTKGMNIIEAVKRLRGPENTKVKLTIMRKEKDWAPKDFLITRAVINVKSVKYKVFENDIGYIRISSFQERTSDELKKAFSAMKHDAPVMNGLIIDVRNNPGGLLDQAVRVSDFFLKSGPIVSIRGRTKTMETKFDATDDGSEPICPMVVLVNEGSASASEILAGALQDNGKAIVLGTQSFGKGSVQTVIPFEDGSALKLTTAKYFTPKGHSIQAEGIMPDIVIEQVNHNSDTKASDYPLREKDLKGHIRGNDEGAPRIKDRSPDDISKDTQLKSAVDLLKSWEIFKKIKS